jgi:hypothetical protein
LLCQNVNKIAVELDVTTEVKEVVNLIRMHLTLWFPPSRNLTFCG